MTTSPPDKKRLSPQAQKWIGVSVLLACLLIGAGIVYILLFGGSPKQRTVAVDPAKQSAGVSGRLAEDRSRRDFPGVHRLNASRWQVTSKTGIMRVTKQKLGYGFAYDFARGFIPADQVALLSSLVRAQVDQAMAAQWGISDEQSKQLRKLNFRQGWLKPAKEDQAALTALWSQYLSAGDASARTEAQRKLVETLESIAAAQFEPSRRALSDRLASARQILGEETLAKLTQR